MSRLVVVGDVLLDTDVEGTVDRLCPDAPAPVLAERRVQRRPGGAGLAASLLAADGHDVTLACAVADDAGGTALRALLAERGVRLLALPEDGTTREKRRLRAQGTSLARWDSGTAGAVTVDEQAYGALLAALTDGHAVLASDYGGPVLRHDDVRRALTATRGRGRPLVWDPHPRGGPPVPGATAVTPNEAEARAAAGPVDGEELPPGLRGAARAADQLVGQWGAGAVVVTRGASGALSSVGDGAPLVVPAPYAATGDPCGAGDRFAAGLAAALGDGAVLSEAVAAAVSAATAFVAAGGAAGAWSSQGHGPDDAGPPRRSRAASRAGSAADVVAAVRARGGTVVATGGCFDLLHAGHVATLQQARALGDCLVVALNADASVRRLKGAGRPLQTAADRAAVLGALDCVDAVAVFDEDTPAALLGRLRPDVWVKGGDYAAAHLPEADVLAGWGGQVVVLPYLTGRSTTGLVTALVGAAQGSAGSAGTDRTTDPNVPDRRST